MRTVRSSVERAPPGPTPPERRGTPSRGGTTGPGRRPGRSGTEAGRGASAPRVVGRCAHLPPPGDARSASGASGERWGASPLPPLPATTSRGAAADRGAQRAVELGAAPWAVRDRARPVRCTRTPGGQPRARRRSPLVEVRAPRPPTCGRPAPASASRDPREWPAPRTGEPPARRADRRGRSAGRGLGRHGPRWPVPPGGGGARARTIGRGPSRGAAVGRAGT